MYSLYKIINAKIHTVTCGTIENGYVTVDSGKILEVGDMSTCKFSKAEDVVDLSSYLLFPGFVDIHTHLGLIKEGENENYIKNKSYEKAITAEYKAINDIDLSDIAFEDAANAGVTTVVISPISTEIIAGQSCVVKTFCRDIGKRLLKQKLGMKIALGENPINAHKKADGSKYSEEEIRDLIVKEFSKAEKHIKQADDNADKNSAYLAMKAAILGQLPVHFHAHSKEDILAAKYIAEKFKLDYSIIHASESHLIIDKLKSSNCNIIQGPFFTNRSKKELINMNMKTSALLYENDLLAAITTDHPELPIQFLPLCASFAHKNGLDSDVAVQMITINPARLCKLDDKIGSIEKGKHADLLAFKENPILNPFEEPVLVIGEGEIIKCEI